MPLVFTPADRKSITRRQVNIITENEAFDITTASLAQQQAKLLEVDNANTVFYAYYDSIVRQYESEYRQMNGQIAAEYTPTDLDNAAQTGIGGIFYPNSPTAYIRYIPLIEDGAFVNNTVRGLFAITGTDTQYESNIFVNTTFSLSLVDLIGVLNNGISGAINTTATIFSFDGTNLIISGSTTNLAIGELIFVGTSPSCGIYKITGITNDMPIMGQTTITVTDILPAAIIPATGTVKNTYLFSATERQNLVSSNWQEILTNLTNTISTLISAWLVKINAQITSLSANQEDRATQIAQIATALADANNTQSIITTWQALPNTGVGAKYTASGILPISNEITARQAFIPTREAQIQTAMGGSLSGALSQSGSTFTSSDLTNVYYKRYVWINIRINRTSGSLRRYYSSGQSGTQVASLKADNNAVKSQYDAYFLTTALSFIDGTNIIYVKSTSGFNPGDTVTLVSETKSETNASVLSVLAADTIKLSILVPVTFKIADTARMFKTL